MVKAWGTVLQVGLQPTSQAARVPGAGLLRKLKVVTRLRRGAAVKGLEAMLTLKPPLILQVALAPRVGLLLALQVVMWMKRVAVLRTSAATPVWLLMFFQAGMVLEVELPLGLQIAMRP